MHQHMRCADAEKEKKSWRIFCTAGKHLLEIKLKLEGGNLATVWPVCPFIFASNLNKTSAKKFTDT